MSEEDGAATKPVIQADDVAQALTRERQEADEPIYTLRESVIIGALDLRHHTVEVAVDIRDCEFRDEVDLRYCEFTQTVDLSGCTFHGRCNCGDESGGHTVYRKDLTCKGAVFEEGVNLNGVLCEGDASFEEARFQNENTLIDLTGASFGKSLNCIKAVFKGGASFNSVRCEIGGFFNHASFENSTQDIDFTAASFEKVLECTETSFAGGASFYGLQCGLAGRFDGARFENEETQTVDFTSASFGKELNCANAIFKGSVNFTSARCEGGGSFRTARFENEEASVDFSYASFGPYLDCDMVTFGGRVSLYSVRCEGSGFFRDARFENEAAEVNFGSASFGSNLHCSGAVYRGPASFNSVRCEGSGFFKGVRFENEEVGVDFIRAFFGSTLECTTSTLRGPATFKGPVSLNSIKCEGDGFFGDARFENEESDVDFGYASFGAGLYCDRALFRGPAAFNSMRCEGSGSFKGVRFDNGRARVDFSRASFGSTLECSMDTSEILATPTTFEGPVSFNSIRCGGTAFFMGARFENVNDGIEFREAVDFKFAEFGNNLQLFNTYFAGDVDLAGAQVSRALLLAGAEFRGRVIFYNAATRILRLGDNFPFAEESLNLSKFTFEEFYSEEPDDRDFAKELLDAQDPAKFSTDPYAQLENYYRRGGEEARANAIYYKGRCDRREHSKAQWSRGKNVADLLLQRLTGYGVYTGRLFWLVLVFVVAGTLVFFPDDSLDVRASTTPAASVGEQVSREFGQKLFERSVYSLDLFIPVLDLQYEKKWVPQALWREAYAVFHVISGWLLIPLLLASLAGLVKSRQ